MGLLTNNGPQLWHPAQDDIKAVCLEAREYCKQKNIELARLAVYYAFSQPGVSTTLVGMNTRELLKANLDVLHNGINKEEQEVLNYLQKK